MWGVWLLLVLLLTQLLRQCAEEQRGGVRGSMRRRSVRTGPRKPCDRLLPVQAVRSERTTGPPILSAVPCECVKAALVLHEHAVLCLPPFQATLLQKHAVLCLPPVKAALLLQRALLCVLCV